MVTYDQSEARAMPPDDVIATETAKHAVNVANAALAIAHARDFDALQCARAVAVMATVVVSDDRAASIALARYLIELASELDPDIAGAARCQ